MIFKELELKGAFVIEPELIKDERGFFARSWCQHEMRQQGLNPDLVQSNISYNSHKGTLRGMHFQAAPYEEAKLVRCTSGAIYDVIIDLRTASATFKQWAGLELTARNRLALYIPEGFAHGFQTLEDESEVFYQMSEFYQADYARGVRWNDPAFGISWPNIENENRIISAKDASYRDFVG